jgi:hypothetical protein
MGWQKSSALLRQHGAASKVLCLTSLFDKVGEIKKC